MIAYLVLRTLKSRVLIGAVAGIMIYISLDELLPAAHEYGHEHDVLLAIVSGMAVTAVSLVLLR